MAASPSRCKLIHSPKRMLHFSSWLWILVESSLFKIILPSYKKRDVEKWEWGRNWQRFLQVLQMRRITICLWNVSYFQSVFNSFPNMTHSSSRARGSDVEAWRRVVLLWSPAAKMTPEMLRRKEKNHRIWRWTTRLHFLQLHGSKAKIFRDMGATNLRSGCDLEPKSAQ